jgi:pimeloyl-ACP methyl ester carboxylesterase
VRACLFVALVSLALLSTACGSDSDSMASTDVSEPTIDERFAVSPDGQQLALLCFGEDAPAIILEPGSDGSGIEEFARVLRPLGEETMTCTYDRLGAGQSDRPSERRRTLDDVVAELHGLIEVAELPVPYVHVGASAGGGIALYDAASNPEKVAGVVLLDVPADDPEELAEFFPGAQAWKNPEHLDYVDGARRLAQLGPSSLEDIPLRVVTATDGQSSVKNQSVWLKLSSDAQQTTLAGGHDLSSENPDGVVAEIQSTVDEIGG